MIPLNLDKRRAAYRRFFNLQNGEPVGDARTVLADLARFCRINRPPLVVSPVTNSTDPIATGVAIGKQEVYRRIEAMLLMPARVRFNLEEEE